MALFVSQEKVRGSSCVKIENCSAVAFGVIEGYPIPEFRHEKQAVAFRFRVVEAKVHTAVIHHAHAASLIARSVVKNRDKVSTLSADVEFCCYDQVDRSGISPLYQDQVRELHRLEKEIELTINPSEEDHKHLVVTIRDMLLCLTTKDVRGLQTALQKTMELTQKILKTEWNRVKSEL